jgi:hypothetical protein
MDFQHASELTVLKIVPHAIKKMNVFLVWMDFCWPKVEHARPTRQLKLNREDFCKVETLLEIAPSQTAKCAMLEFASSAKICTNSSARANA